jgi:hypothetical protein
MRRPKDGNRNLDGERGQQQLDVLDPDLTQPPDITTDKNGDS